jgi:hypothetical protein
MEVGSLQISEVVGHTESKDIRLCNILQKVKAGVQIGIDMQSHSLLLIDALLP